MALAESLLSAIVRADGDALVMHVGERPYVVVGMQTINISTNGLTTESMVGMLAQLLPADAQQQLEEFGAVEHRVPFENEDRFSIVAARGGDDIWIEIRRRRAKPAAEAAPPAPVPAAQPVAAEPVPAPTPVAVAPVEEPKPVEAPQAIATVPVEAPAPVEVAKAAEVPAVEEVKAVAETKPVDDAKPVEEVKPIEELKLVEEARPVAVEQPAPAAASHPVEAPEPVALPVEPEPVVVSAQMQPVEVAVAPEVAPPAVPETEAPAPPASVEFIVPEPEPAPAYSASSTDVAPIEVVEPVIAPVVSEAEPEVVSVEVSTDEPAIEPFPESVFVPPAPIAEPAAAPQPVAMSLPEVEPQQVFESQPVVAVSEPAAVKVIEPEEEQIAASVAEPAPMLQPVAAPMPMPEPMPIASSAERAPEPATVGPMTRTVRIEVPPRAPAAIAPPRSTTDLERLLRMAASRGASALYVPSESRPWMRIEGDLRQLESEPLLSRADVERAILEFAPESGHESIRKGDPTDWTSEFADIGRVRCMTFADHRGPGVLVHMVATKAATCEQLGLSLEVQALATESQGLVLVVGPRGSGKSTVMSALVDLVNRQRGEFVITLERQVRLVHDNKAALVSQREIRGGAEEGVAAVRAALRENPDVLVVDDLVSPHMVPLLLTAASEGRLVLVSITSASTAQAIEQFIELAPPEMRKAVQTAMGESFRGAVGQTLVKKATGGVAAAREVMLATGAVTRAIAEGQMGQLPLVFESGRKHGMMSFTDSLAEYVAAGTVDVREAYRKAADREGLLERLKRGGIDTAIIERLA